MERIEPKIEQYQTYVQQVLEKYSQYKPLWPETEVQTIFDTQRNHYQLVQAGWRELTREYGCIVHMDIKSDGKIWIQYDGTERGMANELVDLGVPKEDIVLAFYAPYRRPYTGFGV